MITSFTRFRNSGRKCFEPRSVKSKSISMNIERAIILSVAVVNLTVAYAGDQGLVAWWKFDEGQGQTVRDTVSGREDALRRNFTYVPGVSGMALKSDGFTTHIIRQAGQAPRLSTAFSIEAWVAPQAYPWNWCAIVNQEATNHDAGYFFGLNETGRLGLQLAVDGKWEECISTSAIPVMTRWSHVVGTFHKDKGIVLYIDGQVAGQRLLKGSLTFAPDIDLQIARNHNRRLMTRELLVRPKVNFPSSYSFDGLIDELKIYDRALARDEVLHAYQAAQPKSPPLQWRKLPQIPAGPKHFGAVYCRLNFYPEWDALWRIGDYPDLVVNFDEGDYKMVFWHGTGYNMNLVTENGRWVGDQSAEQGGRGTIGCCEHMSDKQCRYAHVRVIENHDARVVVHWRYALCDVRYGITQEDPITGWGLWADEYYFIYPDGVAIRYFQVHGTGKCSITEPAALNSPGEKAEDNLDLEAVTLANLQGETRSYSWNPWPNNGRVGAPFDHALTDANICVINFKSRSKPFYIYEPGTRITPYGGGTIELRPGYSKFPTWNHWPVSQYPSDGHYPVVPDCVTSSAVTSPEPPMKRREDSVEGRFIMGLTGQPAAKLAILAKSWLHAPDLKVWQGDCSSEGYDPSQRAYVLKCKRPGQPSAMDIELAGVPERPVVNPCLVIHNWGDAEVALQLNGQELPGGKDFRFGHRDSLEGRDLIVWVKVESTASARMQLAPVPKRAF